MDKYTKYGLLATIFTLVTIGALGVLSLSSALPPQTRFFIFFGGALAQVGVHIYALLGGIELVASQKASKRLK